MVQMRVIGYKNQVCDKYTSGQKKSCIIRLMRKQLTETNSIVMSSLQHFICLYRMTTILATVQKCFWEKHSICWLYSDPNQPITLAGFVNNVYVVPFDCKRNIILRCLRAEGCDFAV